MQPEEVLESTGCAPERYDTSAALRYSGRRTHEKGIRERIVGRVPGLSSGSLQAHPTPGAGWALRVALLGMVRGPVLLAHGDGSAWQRGRDHRLNGPQAIADRWAARQRSVWNRRVGAGSREDDPRWFRLATDHYWTFYPLLADEICGISYELRHLDLRVEGTVMWAGREAVRLSGVPGEEWDWGWIPTPSVGARMSTRPWWMPSAACCCAVPRGWGRRLRRPRGRGDPLRRALLRGHLRSREPLPWP